MTARKSRRTAELVVDPTPRFELSPYLYMQFMEPLGATDGSLAAAWDHRRNCWREDMIEIARELSPTMIRWGGCLASYYRWREGVGARNRRRPMVNLLWGGIEPNQVGTHEFVDFCRRVGAEPLITVNLESDGRDRWANHPTPGARRGTAPEAADWVRYCNQPDHKHRAENGAPEPFNVRFWQLGNETSYDPNGFDVETAARKSLEFARAMRRADPNIKLIGWGDSGWAPRMLEVASEELDYIAFHHHFRSALPDSPLYGTHYRNSPAETWKHLMTAWQSTQAAIDRMRRETAGSGKPLALTESHFGLKGRNRCDVQATWAAGVALARVLNVHSRNGDVLKIATLADFAGTRWMNNAIMLPTPGGHAYMMPVARVMALFRRYGGRRAVSVASSSRALDVTASRAGGTLYLHVANTNRAQPVRAKLKVEGMMMTGGCVHEIADDPMREVDGLEPDVFAPIEKPLAESATWTFPPASVSAIVLRTEV